MIGDPEICIAALARCLGHGFERCRAVGLVGMGMQDPAQILIRYELRQRIGERQLDLVASLAQFRRDERQSQPLVDRLLARRGDQLPALP